MNATELINNTPRVVSFAKSFGELIEMRSIGIGTFSKVVTDLCTEIETLKKANETATELSNATIKNILNGRFVICIKGYEHEGLGFNTGYIESLEKGQQFTSNKAWRRADIEEVINFFLMPESAKPKGRYFI